MKSSLFFVSSDYILAQEVATKVANFFDMRIFDTIGMFEFDHSPRKIQEVLDEFGEEYVNKKMKSVFKMQLDFSDSVLVADLKYLGQTKTFINLIEKQNLIIFINSDNSLTSAEKFNKIELLGSVCDIVVNARNLNLQQVFDETIYEIKKYFNIEA